MITKSPAAVAVIGLGPMGTAVAEALAGGDHRTTRLAPRAGRVRPSGPARRRARADAGDCGARQPGGPLLRAGLPGESRDHGRRGRHDRRQGVREPDAGPARRGQGGRRVDLRPWRPVSRRLHHGGALGRRPAHHPCLLRRRARRLRHASSDPVPAGQGKRLPGDRRRPLPSLYTGALQCAAWTSQLGVLHAFAILAADGQPAADLALYVIECFERAVAQEIPAGLRSR
jgi:hypothetical protein